MRTISDWRSTELQQEPRSEPFEDRAARWRLERKAPDGTKPPAAFAEYQMRSGAAFANPLPKRAHHSGARVQTPQLQILKEIAAARLRTKG